MFSWLGVNFWTPFGTPSQKTTKKTQKKKRPKIRQSPVDRPFFSCLIVCMAFCMRFCLIVAPFWPPNRTKICQNRSFELSWNIMGECPIKYRFRITITDWWVTRYPPRPYQFNHHEPTRDIHHITAFAEAPPAELVLDFDRFSSDHNFTYFFRSVKSFDDFFL